MSVGPVWGVALIVRLEALVVWLETWLLVGESLVCLIGLETLIWLWVGLIGREIRLVEYLVLGGIALRVISRNVVGGLVVVSAGRRRWGLGEERLSGEIRIWVVAVAHDLIIIVRLITGFTVQLFISPI